MQDKISQIFLESSDLKAKIAADPKFLDQTERAINQLLKTINQGGTIYSCGNGGSACDAVHFHEELVARYKKERPGIRSQHLLDAAVISCWANDYEFSSVFSRQIKTMCTSKDTLVVFSTSGNSPNILEALSAAKKLDVFTLGLLGKDGGQAAKLCDLALIVPSSETARIQEVHITLVHTFLEQIEQGLLY